MPGKTVVAENLRFSLKSAQFQSSKALGTTTSDLEVSYFEALSTLPSLAAKWAAKPWTDSDLACVMSALAAAKGHPAIAEAAMEFADANAPGALAWFFEH